MPSANWDEHECRIVVRAYLRMQRELASGEVNKAAVYRRIADELGTRSAKSVERKFQNISAALEELGRPWIKGLLPLRHSQSLLLDIVRDELRRAEGR